MIDATDLYCFSQALGERRNTTAAQRARILEALRHAGPAGVLSSVLVVACAAPCVTKRISELRRMGYRITSSLQALSVADGTLSPLACYVLDEGDANQGDLFA